jgi:protein-disulfide isomerase
MAKLKVPVTPRDHILGPANARVMLVEYSDYECAHCMRIRSSTRCGVISPDN